jgi:membrane-associated phospholipid phosphatase
MPSLVQLDQKWTATIRAWGRPWYGFWKFMAAYSILGFVLLAILLAQTERLMFVHFTGVFVAAYVLASLLQIFIHRQRPNFEKLTGYKLWFQSYSYPSGHATMSAAAATSLSFMANFIQLPFTGGIIGGLIGLAFMIGISRIMVGVHYLADVVFGWIFGFVIAYLYVVIVIY